MVADAPAAGLSRLLIWEKFVDLVWKSSGLCGMMKIKDDILCV